MFKQMSAIALVVFLIGCVGKPQNVEPVDGFVLERYLGKWYEIARLNHSFEEGMTDVTAEYSLRGDGGVAVLNSGYQVDEGRWKSADGKAYFVEQPDTGYLKVSFFGPFYGAYIVFDLDEDYQTSFVSGPDTSYLWLLSRTPQIDADTKQRFIKLAKEKGFDVNTLIWVDHSLQRE